jgi:hypothetical protein
MIITQYEKEGMQGFRILVIFTIFVGPEAGLSRDPFRGVGNIHLARSGHAPSSDHAKKMGLLVLEVVDYLVDYLVDSLESFDNIIINKSKAR